MFMTVSMIPAGVTFSMISTGMAFSMIAAGVAFAVAMIQGGLKGLPQAGS